MGEASAGRPLRAEVRGQSLRLDPTGILLHWNECGGWGLNTYRLCEFRCRYCITAGQGPSVPVLEPAPLRAELAAELQDVASDQRVILGDLRDAYPHVERDLGVTRAAVELLSEQDRPTSIVTKGTGVVRDIDLLATMSDVSVTVSLGTMDEDAALELEPGAPSPQARVETIEQLRRADIAVHVSMAPWIPGRTDVDAVAEAVHSEVMVVVAPLNVAHPNVSSTSFARRFTSSDVARAYEPRGRLAPTNRTSSGFVRNPNRSPWLACARSSRSTANTPVIRRRPTHPTREHRPDDHPRFPIALHPVVHEHVVGHALSDLHDAGVRTTLIVLPRDPRRHRHRGAPRPDPSGCSRGVRPARHG